MIKKDYISIISIVKNDRGIENTLNALRKIIRPVECEIIVVDASNGLIDDIKNKFPEVKWIYYPTLHLKKTTIPEQRNIGLKASKGNIVVFIDANCVPVMKWLVELYTSFKLYGNDIIAGPIIPNKNNVFNNIWDSSNKSILRHECPTANVLINKFVFAKIGYFDERLFYGEDTDLTWRALENGYTIRFNKHAVVYHDWGNFANEIKRSYRYGKSRAVVYKKHLYKWKSILYYDRVAICYALFILFSPIGLLFPYYFLLIGVPICIKLGRMKFKLLLKLLFLNTINGIGIIKGLLLNY